MRIANAPCSWGVLEFEGMAAQPYGYAAVLDEIAATGYAGTELGDWGFLPTDPAVLAADLARRHLAMLGAFVPVRLRDRAAHAAGRDQAVRIARLLAAVATEASQPGPFIVLADDNGADPGRTANAGRATPEMALDAVGWNAFTDGAEAIARAVRTETSLPLVFHHHSAGFVETPEELWRFAEATDPDLVGLVFDTGHYRFNAGPGDASPEQALARLGGRVRHVHFKDCDPAIAAQARDAGWDYFAAIRHGVFCELGKGAVDFPAVVATLRQGRYDGWVVVEQDVLPGMGAPAASARRNRDFLRTLGL
ncbi:MAG: TIM barrel protein [Chloroflexia bacterium]|nr:TIM barrel protein [Chloroflexia bacterium]